MREAVTPDGLNEKQNKQLQTKIKHINDLKKKKFGRLTVKKWDGTIRISKKFGTVDPLVFRSCDCGGSKSVSYASLIRGGSTSCGCKNAEIQKEKAYVPNMVVGTWKLIKLDHISNTKKKKSSQYWLCECTCGCEQQKIVNMRRAHWTFCDIQKEKNQEELMQKKEARELNPVPEGVEDLTGRIFGELEVLGFSFKHINGNKYWLSECSCGNIGCYFDRNLLSGDSQSCGCKGSRGESKIKRLLNKLDLKFVSQYSDERCKDKTILRFDFQVFYPNSNEYFLCEYQGEQHYTPVRWSTKWTDEQTMENFKNVQKKDNIKREFCKKYNIDLLEIKYIDYYEIESLILEQIKNHS